VPEGFTQSGKDTVTLTSIDNIGHPNLPSQGVNLLYGFTRAIENLAQIRRLHARPGTEFLNVNVELKVRQEVTNALTLEELSEVNIIHCERIRREVLDEMAAIYRRALKREGLEDSQIDGMSWRRAEFISARPDLLEAVVRTKRFRHLSAIVFPIVDRASNRKQHRVWLRSDKDVIAAEVVGQPDIKVKLPF
jgi:hypothetical protein